MQNTKKKKPVDFVRERTFGDIIGAPFYFIVQEFKQFAPMLLRFAGPFVAVSFLALSLLANDIYTAAVNNVSSPSTTPVYAFILFLAFLLGALAVTTVTHSYISLYVKNGKGNFTREDVAEMLKKNVWKVFAAGFLTGLISFVGFLLFYIPGIYLSVALSFVFIALIYENKTVGESISRSFEIIRGSWWQTFALVLVFGMIIGAMSYVFIIPIYAVIISASITGNEISSGSTIFITLFVFLYFTAYLFFISMQQVMVAFQYFNLLAQKEGLHLKDKIAAIIKEQPEKEQSKPKEQKSEDINETKPESEKKDEEKNRFSDDDEYDRFKPKY